MRASQRASRLAGAGLLITSAGVAILGAAALGARADDETVTSVPIASFMSVGIGQRVQGLVWRGGIEMQSQTDTFGGLSGLGFTGPDGKLVMVSDRGSFVSGQLI
ncbi:MAG: hypothetical protein JWQ89_1739 [Devosia sp.]|uniref:hypothetical protein n=1 Tax=Devosia sp. TaxID=1871048 RepID=UPI0026251ABE|nr:hypothetical protein [Devosia sp.]MDB5540012.1 hypothetical protein [Devosia sp.]